MIVFQAVLMYTSATLAQKRGGGGGGGTIANLSAQCSPSNTPAPTTSKTPTSSATLVPSSKWPETTVTPTARGGSMPAAAIVAGATQSQVYSAFPINGRSD